VPEGVIEELVTTDVVKDQIGLKVLAEIPEEDQEEVLDFVMSEAKKVFVITVCANIEGEDLLYAMQLFKDEDINDKSLPIIRDDEVRRRARENKTFAFPASTDSIALGSEDTLRQESELTRIDPEEHVWTSGRRMDFYQKQWRFLAPVFRTSDDGSNLNRKQILPFIFMDDGHVSGGFGQVFQVAIHPQHIEDKGNLVRFIQPLTSSSAKNVNAD
jgi:hypothetical protein